MERFGRFVHISAHRSPEEQVELTTTMASSEPMLRAELKEKAQALQDKLSKYDTFQVLSALSLMNHLADPETYKEWSHEGRPAFAEYAALIALRRAYSPGSELYATGKDLQELQTSIEELHGQAMWLQIAKSAASSVARGTPGGPPSALDEMRFKTRLYETYVRRPAYEHHHYEVLRGLFISFEDELVKHVGFSLEDAISLANAIPSRINRLLQEKKNIAAEQLGEMRGQIQRFRQLRRKGGADSGEPGGYFAQVAARPAKEDDRHVAFAIGEWLLFCAGDICEFSVEDLCHETGIPRDRVESFLTAFSMEFPGVDPEFVEPSPTHGLRYRPILKHGESYLCPGLLLLDWAIQPGFEAALKKAGAKLWARYHKHRHDFVLAKAMQCLQAVMPSAQVSSNLFYRPSKPGAELAELDGLCIYDSLAIFAEVKAADFTDPAKRGAPERLLDNLSDSGLSILVR